MAKILVTGAAGFVGSHVADALIAQGHKVVAYDNLTTGRPEFVPKTAEFIEGWLSERATLEGALSGCESVYHFAGHADVRRNGQDCGWRSFSDNVEGTFNVLTAMHRTGVKEIVFASSAVVYGEPSVIPTPESYSGDQTSFYGVSKLFGAAWIQAHCSTYGTTGSIFRFVSLVGERYGHGVVFDFTKALLSHPEYLDIAGDGTQQKSYLYIDDCVHGILMAPKPPRQVSTYNLGHEYTIPVSKVAEIVTSEMGLENVRLNYGSSNRGWVGDSPVVHLDTTKIRKFGWHSPVSVEEGIRRTVRYLLNNRHILTQHQ
jgi:UDP-glucose 4-epimerase